MLEKILLMPLPAPNMDLLSTISCSPLLTGVLWDTHEYSESLDVTPSQYYRMWGFTTVWRTDHLCQVRQPAALFSCKGMFSFALPWFGSAATCSIDVIFSSGLDFALTPLAGALCLSIRNIACIRSAYSNFCSMISSLSA